MAELNLTELLKNCPKGTKFYSPVFGILEFLEVVENAKYPIFFKTKDGYERAFLNNGKLSEDPIARCMIFPSINCQTWEGYKPHEQYEDGEILYLEESNSKSSWVFIYSKNRSNAKTSAYISIRLDDYAITNVLKCICKDEHITKLDKATESESSFLFNRLIKCGYFWDFQEKKVKHLKFKVGDFIIKKGMESPQKIVKINHSCYILTDGYVGLKEQDGCEKVQDLMAEVKSPNKVAWFEWSENKYENTLLIKTFEKITGCRLIDHLDPKTIKPGHVIFNVSNKVECKPSSSWLTKCAQMFGIKISIKR